MAGVDFLCVGDKVAILDRIVSVAEESLWPAERLSRGRRKWRLSNPYNGLGLSDSVPGRPAGHLSGMRIRLSNFGCARIDAGEAWCVRARATAWRGDLWDRSLLLRARRPDSYTGGPLRATGSIAVRRELSCGCDGRAVRRSRCASR